MGAGLPVGLIPSWILTSLLVTSLAAFFGTYDLLVVTTCAIPALLFFGFSYAANVTSYLPDNGHTMYDIAGGIPPFDFAHQSVFLLEALAWALSTAGVALLLKRCLFPSPSAQPEHLWRSVVIDLGTLALVLAVILGFDLRHQLRLGEPSVITANVARMLDSPTSTPAEREVALFDMSGFSDRFKPDDIRAAVAMLQREVRVQPEPVNLVVAEELLRFHDLSALPLIEDALMHSSDPARTAPPGGWESLAGSLASTHDVTALPALDRLLESPDVATRRGAARAIREIRSPETIDPQIKELDDPDPDVQRIGYYGLLEILDHQRSQYHWEIPPYDHSADPAQNYETRLAALQAWARDWAANRPGK